jgi:hypothetical protein
MNPIVPMFFNAKFKISWQFPEAGNEPRKLKGSLYESVLPVGGVRRVGGWFHEFVGSEYSAWCRDGGPGGSNRWRDYWGKQ